MTKCFFYAKDGFVLQEEKEFPEDKPSNIFRMHQFPKIEDDKPRRQYKFDERQFMLRKHFHIQDQLIAYYEEI